MKKLKAKEFLEQEWKEELRHNWEVKWNWRDYPDEAMEKIILFISRKLSEQRKEALAREKILRDVHHKRKRLEVNPSRP